MLSERDKTKLAELLGNENTFATTLLAICFDSYGTAVLDWEPETLWTELFEDFGTLLPTVNKDKLQALITCYTTNSFYRSWEVFAQVCNVFSGSDADFVTLDVVTAEEALWGMYEVMLNFDEHEEFSDEIKKFLGVVLNTDGILEPPDLLRVAVRKQAPGISQWADDPIMFNALSDKNTSDRNDLTVGVKARLSELVNELGSAPLANRDAEAWSKFADKVKTLLAATA